MRKIFALPCRYGGLSITNISEVSDKEYEYSLRVTKDLTDAIYHQSPEYRENGVRQAELKTAVSIY